MWMVAAKELIYRWQESFRLKNENIDFKWSAKLWQTTDPRCQDAGKGWPMAT